MRADAGVVRLAASSLWYVHTTGAARMMPASIKCNASPHTVDSVIDVLAPLRKAAVSDDRHRAVMGVVNALVHAPKSRAPSWIKNALCRPGGGAR